MEVRQAAAWRDPAIPRAHFAYLTTIAAALFLFAACSEGTAPVADEITDAVLFESDRDGQFEIYAVSPRSRRLWRLTDQIRDDHDPAWSPDGSRLAFVSNRLDTPTLWVMDASGLDQRRLGAIEFVSRPTWSPDGASIMVSANNEVFVLNVATEETRRVSLPTEEARRPVWSPDGTRIAYSSDRFGTLDIIVVNAESGALVERLTDSQASDLTGSWSWR